MRPSRFVHERAESPGNSQRAACIGRVESEKICLTTDKLGVCYKLKIAMMAMIGQNAEKPSIIVMTAVFTLPLAAPASRFSRG